MGSYQWEDARWGLLVVLGLSIVEQALAGLRRPGYGMAGIVRLGGAEELVEVLGLGGDLVAEPEVERLSLVEQVPVDREWSAAAPLGKMRLLR